MITLFTTPRAFRGLFNIPQRNAIKSWTLLEPKCEIILFGNEEGVAEAAKEFGARHVPEIELNEFKTPIAGAIFNTARKLANNPLIGYLTGDIILFGDFMKAVLKMPKDNFLMVGGRWDLNINEKIDFDDNDWEKKIKEEIKGGEKRHGLSGADCFVFPKDVFWGIPPFILGSPGGDNWLIYKARTLKIPVIDATEEVTIIHQNHGRPRKNEDFYKFERQKNFELAGGSNSMCSLYDADWVLTPDGLERPPFPRRIFSELTLFKPWRCLVTIKRIIQKYLKMNY